MVSFVVIFFYQYNHAPLFFLVVLMACGIFSLKSSNPALPLLLEMPGSFGFMINDEKTRLSDNFSFLL